LAGLPDQPHRALPEIGVVLPACLHRRFSLRRCLHGTRGNPVRQLIVTGLGRDAPTVIISNDDNTKTRALIARYARRMTIEQRLAEIIRAFSADALSSTVNLNVDLDITLAVLAQALLAALRARLPGYAAVTPDTIQRRFLETPGQIITTPDTITIRLARRAFSPVLRKASLPDTRVPWLGNRTIRYEYA
ncbi:MAG: hypothetical protein ACRDOK_21900, partial [Streptosporangiaceae bacterium]